MVCRRKKSLSLALAVHWGEVCRECKGGSCTDPPSELEPAFLNAFPCEACDGTGEMADAVCAACNGQRKTKLTGCPTKMVNDSARVAMRAADFARKGVLPLSGGWLDQTDGCMKAIQFIWSIEDVFLARAGKKD